MMFILWLLLGLSVFACIADLWVRYHTRALGHMERSPSFQDALGFFSRWRFILVRGAHYFFIAVLALWHLEVAIGGALFFAGGHIYAAVRSWIRLHRAKNTGANAAHA